MQVGVGAGMGAGVRVLVGAAVEVGDGHGAKPYITERNDGRSRALATGSCFGKRRERTWD